MGVDIYAVIETDYGRRWGIAAELNLPRSYAIFEAMGYLDDEESQAIVASRGWPKDISDSTAEALEYAEFGKSYLTTAEFSQAIEKADKVCFNKRGVRLHAEYFAAQAYMRELEKLGTICRIVFGFN